MTTTPALRLDAASFGYDGKPVVGDVSVSVEPGEVVAVLGPNGSGKSTLVKGLVGLTEQLSGTAEAFGMPVTQPDARARIGYVPQRHTLASSVSATAAEIVAIGRLRFRPWWRPWQRDLPADRMAIARALDQVGLGDRAGTPVTNLSGGQQRRVLIARALASVPDLLLMDEPTAGVDRANQHLLSEILGRLATEGTTMVIVTHEVAALATALTRVLVISDGRLVFDGSAQDYAAAGFVDEHAHHPIPLPGSTTGLRDVATRDPHHA